MKKIIFLYFYYKLVFMFNIELNGKTKAVILIGNPVEHSMSPKMHTAAFKEVGINAIYIATKVENEDVKAAVESIRALNFLGANVTIPHKVSVISFIDEINPIAKDIGAINTIVNKNKKLFATNTDGPGFMRSMKEAGIKLNGMNAVMIGAGGVARAISFYLLQEINNLRITDINSEIGDELIINLQKKYGEKVSFFNLNKNNLKYEIKNADLLLNCTPIGMYPNQDKTPVPKEYLRKDLIVFDSVYNPIETLLIKNAEKVGGKAIGGINMFLHQGAEAFELWTNKKAPIELMKQIIIKDLNRK